MRRNFGFLLLALLIPVQTYADFNRFPTYLFFDARYWLFVLLYILITTKIVQWTLAAAPGAKERLDSFPLKDVSKAASIIFGMALIYQSAHHSEHVTQIFQWWYMSLPPPQAKGIIFFADLEWNHYIFDKGYFILLMIGSLLFVRQWWLSGHRMGKMGAFLMLSMNIIQGWHAVEHTYRIVHHIKDGCDPCAGIVDQLTGVPLIPLHFWYNVLALTFPLMIFFWFGMHQKLLQMIRSKKAATMEKQMPVMTLSH